jgi:hypothetical protein
VIVSPRPAQRLGWNLAGVVWPSSWGLLITLLLTAIVSLPLCFVTYPPLYDYPFHLARLQILRDIWNGGPLSEYYQINSFIIPNVAMDLIVFLLQLLLSVQNAGRAFLIITTFLTISGASYLSWTASKQNWLAPWLTALLLYNIVFGLGFVNYLFGLALLPWALAIFIRIKHASGVLRLICGTLICLILFFSHLVAFALYAVAASALELEWSLPLLRTHLRQVLARAAVVGAPILAMLMLFVALSPTAHAAGAPVTYDNFRSWLGFVRYKIYLPGIVLRSGVDWVDYVSIGAMLVPAGFVLLTGTVRIRRDLLLAIVLLVATYWAAPGHVFSAAAMDIRMPLAPLLLLAAGLEIRIEGMRTRTMIVASLLCLLGFRSAAIADDWRATDRVESQLIRAYGCLAPHSVLFAAEADPSLDRPPGPPLGHFASLAAVTNGIFVPATWAHPAQQPIAVRAAYADIYLFQSPDQFFVADRVSLQTKIAEIREVLVRRRMAGKDDFRGNVYLILFFPILAGDPQIEEASVIAAQKFFTLYGLSIGPEDPSRVAAGNCQQPLPGGGLR